MPTRFPLLVKITFVVLYIASSFLIAKYLELPSNWYSREVLQTLPPSKILELTLGALSAALFGAYAVHQVMLSLSFQT